jgi:tellurite resistance-related uncharacterized protein
MTHPVPYRSTPVFTNDTLPEGLRRAHSTKVGVWGLLKDLKGSTLYVAEETGERQIVRAPGTIVIYPHQLHSVEPQDDMEMQVDFYHQAPDSTPATSSSQA